MSYIKRKRDRRTHETKRAIEAQAIWRPRILMGLNEEAIKEEIAIGNERIWSITDEQALTFNMPVWNGR